MLVKNCDKRSDSKSILDSLNGLGSLNDLIKTDKSIFFHVLLIEEFVWIFRVLNKNYWFLGYTRHRFAIIW